MSIQGNALDKDFLPWEREGNPISRRLVSLMDVLRFCADTFVIVLGTLQTVEDILYYKVSSCQREAVRSYSDNVANDGFAYKPSLEILNDECQKLELYASHKLIKHIISELNIVTYGGLKEQLKTLRAIIEDELGDRLFVFIAKDKSLYIDKQELFGQEVSSSFPSAQEDIKEAGNCYAIGLHTACVFHLMRVLEHGLRALAKDVNRIFDKQQWHNIINEIESEIDKIRKGKNFDGKKERLQFLSEAAKEFSYFKDGWRNYVSHGHSKYDGPQALSAMNHVKAFMIHLSTKLTE